MALQIVLIEREAFVRRSLERLLTGTPSMTVSGSAASVREAEALPLYTPADIVLAGTDLPDMQLTAGVRRLVERFPRAQVVMLGPASEPGLVIGAIRAGADGYLARGIPPAGLVRALQGVERGEAALPRALTYLLIEALRYGMPQGLDDGALLRLSRRERDVLREIGRGCSNAEIAHRLGVSESTIKTHVSNILRKTGSRSRFVLQAASQG